MKKFTVPFSSGSTDFYFGTNFEELKSLAPIENTFIITDENLMVHYQQQLKRWPVIIVPAGEESKSLAVLDDVLRQLLALDADRNALIIGFGGGVVTDIAGFTAGIYKRGVRCGLVPTSVLGMVDAAVGGKNGLNIGDYKNMMGLVRQPEFLLYDPLLLDTLPEEEWVNGFAEIIKHAAILDPKMFALLQEHQLQDFKRDVDLLQGLIQINSLLKAKLVQTDEHEKKERKWLNFGHTLAHAIETIYQLPHGQAVARGMAVAADLSEERTGFTEAQSLKDLLEQYQLDTRFNFDASRALMQLPADKKRFGEKVQYVLLESIGKAVIHPLSLPEIRSAWEDTTK